MFKKICMLIVTCVTLTAQALTPFKYEESLNLMFSHPFVFTIESRKAIYGLTLKWLEENMDTIDNHRGNLSKTDKEYTEKIIYMASVIDLSMQLDTGILN